MESIIYKQKAVYLINDGLAAFSRGGRCNHVYRLSKFFINTGKVKEGNRFYQSLS